MECRCVSTAAKRVAVEETDYRIEEIEALADFVYDNDDIGAPPASGSFQTDGMIVAACSIQHRWEGSKGPWISIGPGDRGAARTASAIPGGHG